MTAAPEPVPGQATGRAETPARMRLRTALAAGLVLAGALFPVLGAVVMVRWALADIPHVGYDPDGASPARIAVLWGVQAASLLAEICVVIVVIVGCLRQRRLTVLGMLLIAYTSAFWMAPILNYTYWGVHISRSTLYTTAWGPYVPGWHGGPPERQVEAVFLNSWLGYVAGVLWLLGMIAAVKLLVLRRRPRMRGWRLFLAVTALALPVDVVLEAPVVPSGEYSNVSAIPQLTLLSGHSYQMPLYLMFLTGFCWSALPYLLWHQHEKSDRRTGILHTLAVLPRPWRTPAQTLAVVGYVNLSILAWSAAVAFCATLGASHPLPELPAHLR
ncbi:spirocyclase AveC family protein [Streptomyces klenkii]|uniref:spirocyclase AveC family protein n=1 Tax=Streptomyces klenkii TaxID=1420899 RepID=UPI00342723BA